MKLSPALLLIASLAFAQEKPKPALSALPEVESLRILDAYKTAFVLQGEVINAKESACDATPACSKLKTAAQDAATAYYKALAEAKKNLPVGAEIQLTPNPNGSGLPNGTAVVMAPPKEATPPTTPAQVPAAPAKQ